MQIEFGDDLLRQVGIDQNLPEDTEIKQLKFDARGTVHVLARDSSEKLIKDIPIKDIPIEITEPSLESELLQEYNQLRAKNAKFSNTVLLILIPLLILLLVNGFVVWFYN